jgi:hypothetical protein
MLDMKMDEPTAALGVGILLLITGALLAQGNEGLGLIAMAIGGLIASVGIIGLGGAMGIRSARD